MTASSPRRPGSPLRSPKGPRPLTTPRRDILSTPSRQRPFLTPPTRRPIPALMLITATPDHSPNYSPTPRRWDRDPYRLGEHWFASPLSLRIASAKEAQEHFAPSQTAFASSAAHHAQGTAAPHSGYGPFRGLIEDLVYLATIDDTVLSTIPKNEILAVVDDILCVVFEEDRGAVNDVLFGKENDKDDLEGRTHEQLQEICMSLAEEIAVIEGKLRFVTDDSIF